MSARKEGGLFRKITGIVGIIVVLGVITMVIISPRTDGFFPGMFDFVRGWIN